MEQAEGWIQREIQSAGVPDRIRCLLWVMNLAVIPALAECGGQWGETPGDLPRSK